MYMPTIMNHGSVWRSGNIVEGNVNSSSATVTLTTSTPTNPTKGWLSWSVPHFVYACVRLFVCLFVCVGGQSSLRLEWQISIICMCLVFFLFSALRATLDEGHNGNKLLSRVHSPSPLLFPVPSINQPSTHCGITHSWWFTFACIK